MNDKIQTGLRIPEELYNQLREAYERTGVSINAQILFLIDIGMRAVNLGIQAAGRDPSRIGSDTDPQCTPRAC